MPGSSYKSGPPVWFERVNCPSLGVLQGLPGLKDACCWLQQTHHSLLRCTIIDIQTMCLCMVALSLSLSSSCRPDQTGSVRRLSILTSVRPSDRPSVLRPPHCHHHHPCCHRRHPCPSPLHCLCYCLGLGHAQLVAIARHCHHCHYHRHNCHHGCGSGVVVRVVILILIKI
jgi:hypothetical protein